MEFSTKSASKIDKSSLPASAFLIVGDKDNKSTWHLPFKDEQGNVNVGLLRAARQTAKNKEFRGQKISFSIPPEVMQKIDRLWEEWQKMKGNEMMSSEIPEENHVVTEGKFTGELQEWDAILDPVNVFESVEWEEKQEGAGSARRFATVTVNTQGWSANGRYYSKSAVEQIAKHLTMRPKFYAGHEIRDPIRKIDRPITESVAVVAKDADGEFQAWAEEGTDGRMRAKARIRFTNYTVGEQTRLEAIEDPSSVRLSINGRVRIRKDSEAEGRKGDVVEDVVYLYSPDFVSYDAAGGHVDSVESFQNEMDMVEAVGAGYYKRRDEKKKPQRVEKTESKTKEKKIVEPDEPDKGESKMKFEFETATDAASNEEIREAVLKGVDVGELEVQVDGKSVKVSEAISALVSENKGLKEQNERYLAAQRVQQKQAWFTEAIKHHKLDQDSVTESLKDRALAQTDDEKPDSFESMSTEEQEKYRSAKQKIFALVGEHKKEIEALIKRTVESINGKKNGNAGGDFIESLLSQSQEEKTENAEEVDKRLVSYFK